MEVLAVERSLSFFNFCHMTEWLVKRDIRFFGNNVGKLLAYHKNAIFCCSLFLLFVENDVLRVLSQFRVISRQFRRGVCFVLFEEFICTKRRPSWLKSINTANLACCSLFVPMWEMKF